jgi:hypothetical protein
MIGRPEKNIDSEELQRILTFYPSLDEVAAWFDCSPDTIERRVKDEWGVAFKELRERYTAKTRLLLKRKAIAKALEEDNDKMLIYCLRTMTDLDDREAALKISNENKMLSLNYTLSFISEDEKNL